MTVRKVLVAFDGLENSKRALELTADLIRTNPSIQLDIATVVAIPLLSESQLESFASILEAMEQDAKDVLTKALEDLEEDGDFDNEVQTLIVKGVDPANEIMKLSEQEGYDLIVLGSRGLSGIKSYIGSVSHKLLNISKIPVLIAK